MKDYTQILDKTSTHLWWKFLPSSPSPFRQWKFNVKGTLYHIYEDSTISRYLNRVLLRLIKLMYVIKF